MRVEVVTPAVIEPLDMAKVKVELRIDSDEDNARVLRLIRGARSLFEEETGHALISRTLKAYLRFWPKATNILLPYPPLISVTSVTSYPLGVSTVLSTNAYHVDNQSRQGSVVLVPGTSWPTAVLYPPGIAVIYVAGFGDAASDIPPDILQCLMEIVAFWDEVPEAAYVPGTNKTSGKVEILPFGAQSVIERYQKQRDR